MLKPTSLLEPTFLPPRDEKPPALRREQQGEGGEVRPATTKGKNPFGRPYPKEKVAGHNPRRTPCVAGLKGRRRRGISNPLRLAYMLYIKDSRDRRAGQRE